MAKLFTNATLRPVGCPVSVQLPVSSSTVRSNPISITSPTTPLISTQSPTRIPFFPISTNHPKNPTIKSFSATVSPAPANPRMVGIWLGTPRISNALVEVGEQLQVVGKMLKGIHGGRGSFFRNRPRCSSFAKLHSLLLCLFFLWFFLANATLQGVVLCEQFGSHFLRQASRRLEVRALVSQPHPSTHLAD